MTQSSVKRRVQLLLPVAENLQITQRALFDYEDSIGVDNFIRGLKEHIRISYALAIDLIEYLKNFPVIDDKNNG